MQPRVQDKPSFKQEMSADGTVATNLWDVLPRVS